MRATPWWLRSSAVTEDGRHASPRGAGWRSPQGCDPRPSRRTAATRLPHQPDPPAEGVAILGRHGGRPPQARGHAARADQRVAILGRHGGRPPHDLRRRISAGEWLRSSAVTEDGRHWSRSRSWPGRHRVAILGRHGGRPPLLIGYARVSTAEQLRSSAVTEDGRHRKRHCPASRRAASCDPRPSRRTAATSPRESRKPLTWELRSSAVTEDGRHCMISRRLISSEALRSSAVTEDGRHLLGLPARWQHVLVAILGRHGGRPPRDDHLTNARLEGLRSSAVTEDGRHTPRQVRILSNLNCCDPRPSRRTAATSRAGRLPRLERGCDPRPSRRTAATVYDRL